MVIAGHFHGCNCDCGIVEEDIAFRLHDDSIGFSTCDAIGEGKHFKTVHLVIDGEGLEILIRESGKIDFL